MNPDNFFNTLAQNVRDALEARGMPQSLNEGELGWVPTHNSVWSYVAVRHRIPGTTFPGTCTLRTEEDERRVVAANRRYGAVLKAAGLVVRAYSPFGEPRVTLHDNMPAIVRETQVMRLYTRWLRRTRPLIWSTLRGLRDEGDIIAYADSLRASEKRPVERCLLVLGASPLLLVSAASDVRYRYHAIPRGPATWPTQLLLYTLTIIGASASAASAEKAVTRA